MFAGRDEPGDGARGGPLRTTASSAFLRRSTKGCTSRSRSDVGRGCRSRSEAAYTGCSKRTCRPRSHFSSLLRSGGRTTAMGSAFSRTRTSYQGGIAMTVTKSYVARNYGLRDRIIDNLGVVAAVLVVGFVLLFFSGAIDFGRDISMKIDQASMQGSAQ